MELSEAEAEAAATAHYGKPVALVRDSDVLDTWFSSGLWPFSTLGWPEKTTALERYYPTDVLVTGFDIIFFWVARMMMLGLHFMGDVPFREIYIHALVRDEKGQKMSKSKGNIIDPLVLIDKYGCDALRFTLSALAAQGRDIKLAESRVEGYRNFATKLWNAARFCQMNDCRPVPGFDPATAKEQVNRWIAGKLTDATSRIGQAIESYRFNDAANAAYQFVWNSFCDWYVEFAKPILQGDDGEPKEETRAMAAWVLDQILHLLHPFMPFITEELWGQLADDRGRFLATSEWPSLDFQDAGVEAELDWLVRVISSIRAVRAEMNVPPGARVPLLIKGAGEETKKRLATHRDSIMTLARAASLTLAEDAQSKGAVQVVVDEATILLPLADVVDLAQEKSRLAKEIAKLSNEIEKSEKKLGNREFIAKAPTEVVEEQRERLGEWVAARSKLTEALDRFSSV